MADHPLAPSAAAAVARPVVVLSRLLGAWAALSTTALLVIALTTRQPALRAAAGMLIGTAVVWIGLAGAAMFLLRGRARAASARRGWRHRRVAFTVFATALALVEEAVTTTMTNLAPAWGVSVRDAHITASANYLEVVALHSVVVFIPMFAAWAWLSGRYRFSAGAAFILFGLTGVAAETLSGGPFDALLGGFWVYVYGLMVFLPAYCLPPPARDAHRPGVTAVVVALVLPLLAALPVALVVQRLT